MVTVASAGPNANHLHLAADRQLCQHVITQYFYRTDALPELNQQRQITEGNRSVNQQNAANSRITTKTSDNCCYSCA